MNNEQVLPHSFTRLQSNAVSFHSAFRIVSNFHHSNHSHSGIKSLKNAALVNDSKAMCKTQSGVFMKINPGPESLTTSVMSTKKRHHLLIV